MSRPTCTSPLIALAVGVIGLGGSGWAAAAPLRPDIVQGMQQAPVTPVHYQGGSHCHPNCVLGQCHPVCHCRVGKSWYTVKGTSCPRSTQPHNITAPKCPGGRC
jgi:hypothetical protein